MKSFIEKVLRMKTDDSKNESDDDVTILFADISRSTSIYESLGDIKARELIYACLSLMADITEKHNGTVIKTIGDEIMCTFPIANDAAAAAEEMHNALENSSEISKPPNIRIGFHSGEVVEENNDVYGDAVNVASRMADMAKPRQIITTAKTVNELVLYYQARTRCIDRTVLKGKRGNINIYELIWEENDATLVVRRSSPSPVITSRMKISLGAKIIEINDQRNCVTMGRQAHNDLVVQDTRASRSHARIELRRGKFYLIDEQSSNGTYLLVEKKKSLRVKHDEVVLTGKGVVGLGNDVTPDSPDAIHFKIES
ncbi:adenylate/guanylate cyclase domain-containing protein [Desulfococcaceae bacterium HSG7]|nr:adenylate/guanylate cyclase domain-containing protein [Desulfococcaceae bacterium HSG9]MDM8555654.1 adenylate/guanylate cyclase domain-containing protein [Desulfococcaceae bacterium HSG7]